MAGSTLEVSTDLIINLPISLPDKITPTPSAAPIFKLDRELRIERHKPLALNPLYIDFTTFDDNI